jgi:histidinol phosphatase-like enzyme
LDDLLFCPHHPDRGYPEENPAYKMPCACRKPAPGMLLTAAERYHIDLSCSYIIGDSPADIEAGKAAGCLTVGIRTGGEPDYLCGNLREAVEWILEKEPLCDYS